MNVHYIAPSVIPSRSANAVHVILQVRALADIAPGVTFYFSTAVTDDKRLRRAIEEQYGISCDGIRFVAVPETRWGVNLRIAAVAVRRLVFGRADGAVISRNLYASFILGVIGRRTLLYETHQIEHGFRAALQRLLMTRTWITTVLISRRLLELLETHHGVAIRRPLILRDAARTGVRPVAPESRRPQLTKFFPVASGPWTAVCGYFGQLHAGRGIEVIQQVARQRPDILFLVVGGMDADVEAYRSSTRLHNVHFAGHISHFEAQRMMALTDVLLMPYQSRVSIGVAGHDTARWMSPMKMFEYMAAGVPIVASNLPALCEVLRDGENGLLVSPEAADEWAAAIDSLVADPLLAQRLAGRAHAEYEAEYTWARRAERLLTASEAGRSLSHYQRAM